MIRRSSPPNASCLSLLIDLRAREQAMLVTVIFRKARYRDSWSNRDIADELRALVHSAGVEILQEMLAVREAPTPNLLIGRGKVDELRAATQDRHANVVIFNTDLSPTQQRNLEEAIGTKVIDRTQLILDIFAQRAHSEEGKVQVALAQHAYLLPRLSGRGIELSRLGGGIGTRGPGEQKLEVDRRRIRTHIGKLQHSLDVIRERRGHARQQRGVHAVPTAALIGYTNAGKSTLFNRLTHAQAPAHDQLFTTLDPRARRVVLPTRQPIVVSDTVGFLHQLPHHLIEAFQATLEEVREAHLLLHVIDASHPLYEAQITAVDDVLKEIHSLTAPRLLVFNKIDLLPAASRRALARARPEAVCLSALTGEGVPMLLDRLIQSLGQLWVMVSVTLPHTTPEWVHRLYQEGSVLAREDRESAIHLDALVPPALKADLARHGFLAGFLT